MTDKQVQILAVVALVLVLTAAFLYSGIDLFSDSFVAGGALIQGLDTSKIAKITISSAESSTTLVKEGEAFLIEEKNNYPASTEKINDMLLKVLDMRLADRITRNPAIHEEHGLVENSIDGKKIAFFNAEGDVLTGLYSGKGLPRRSGVYVRKLNEDIVYGTSEYVFIADKPIDYINTDIFDVDAERIERVEVSLPDGTTYSIARKPASNTVEQETADSASEDENVAAEPENRTVQLLDTPEGREADEDMFIDVFEILAVLKIADVLPAAQVDVQWDGRYVAELESGLQFVAMTAEKDGTYYMLVQAVSPVTEQIRITQTESDEELKRKEALLLANDRAEEFIQTNSGWVYVIDAVDAEELRRPLEDLLVEPEEDDEGEDASP